MATQLRTSMDPNLARKQRAISMQQAQQQVSTQEPTFDVSTAEGEIAKYRYELEKSKEPLTAFEKQYLKARRRTAAFTPRKQRAEIQKTGREVKSQLGALQQQEYTTEMDIAKSRPELARPEYKVKVLAEAKTKIQSRVNDLQNKLSGLEQQRAKYEAKARDSNRSRSSRESAEARVDRIDDDISIIKAELGGWQEGLGGDENSIIKKFFSGYTESNANYKAQSREARVNQQKQFREMKGTEEFKKTLSELNLKPTASLQQFQDALRKAESAQKYKQQLVKWGEKVGFEQLPDSAKKQLGLDTSVNYYKKPMDAWYDPLSGKEVLQSIDPTVAANMGYLPIKLLGEKKGGGYLVESKSGLLTQKQRDYMGALSGSQGLRNFLGVSSAALPTTFVLGGKDTRTPEQKFLDITSPSKTTYDLAGRQRAYTPQTLSSIETYRKYGRLDINEPSNILPNNITNSTAISNLSKSEEASVLRGAGKAAWLQYGYGNEQIATSESGLNKFIDNVLAKLKITGKSISQKQRSELRNYLKSDRFRQEAMRGIDDPDIRKYYRTVQAGTAVLPSGGWTLSPAIGTLLDVTEKPEPPTFKEAGLSIATNTAAAYITNKLVGFNRAGSLLTKGAKAGGTLFSGKIVEFDPVSKLLPSRSTGFAPSGAPRQVARGLGYSLLMGVPGFSQAYAKEFSMSLLSNPIKTTKGFYEYAKENPYEIATTFRKQLKTPYDYLTGRKIKKIVTTEKFPRIPRQVTLKYLKRRGLIKSYAGELASPLKLNLLTGSTVKEPFGRKVLLPELRAVYKSKYYKIREIGGEYNIKINNKYTPISKLKNVKVLSSGGQAIAYGTPQLGESTFAGGQIFVESIGRNPAYWKNWVKQAKKIGIRSAIKKYGLPKPKYSNFMVNEGQYFPKKAGESVNAYYKRLQGIADKSGKVVVADPPKTLAKYSQPEFEIVYLYPRDSFGRVTVSRVNIGTDSFGRTVYKEFPRKISIAERVGTKLKAKAVNYKSYFEGFKAKISQDTSSLMRLKYGDLYVNTVDYFKNKWDKSGREHFSNVESNLRKIVKDYNLPYSNNLIRAFARIHDILKLRGINVTDEAIVRKAISKGHLDSIPEIKALTSAEKALLSKTVGLHHVANPNPYYNTLLNNFQKAAINADRLDITRYGKVVDLKRLFKIKKGLSVEGNILKQNRDYWRNLPKNVKDSILLAEKEYEYTYSPKENILTGYAPAVKSEPSYKGYKPTRKEYGYKDAKKEYPSLTLLTGYKPTKGVVSYKKPAYTKPSKSSYASSILVSPQKKAPYQKPSKTPYLIAPPARYKKPTITKQKPSPYTTPKPKTDRIPVEQLMGPRVETRRKRPTPKKSKKKIEKRVLPTIAQQLIGKRRRTKIRKVTGFEVLRI